MPHPPPTEIVARFNAAWAAGDIDSALACVADDAVYELHISKDVLAFGGATEGRDNIEAVLHRMQAEWECILFRPLTLAVDGEFVRYQVEFMYRHRAAGEMLSGRLRLVIHVKDGRIVRANEYHDVAKVEAFLRFIGVVRDS